MASVFPWFGSYGYEAADAYDQVVHFFPDGTYYRYLINPFNHREAILSFDAVKKQIHDDVQAFFNARLSSTNDFEFLFYHPDEIADGTLTVDLSGMTSQGLYKAIFDPDQGGGSQSNSQRPELRWTRVGRCRWSAKIRIIILGPGS
jgi:hypothetical protein